MEVEESESPVYIVTQETIYVKPEIDDSCDSSDENLTICENIYVKLENDTEDSNTHEGKDSLKEVPLKESKSSTWKGKSHPKIKSIESSAAKNEVLSEDDRPNYSKKGKQSRKNKNKKENNNLSINPDDVLSANDIIMYIEMIKLTEEEREAEHRVVMERLIGSHSVCDGCALAFTCDKDFEAHLKLHSDDQGPFECDICRIRFESASCVEKHRLQHYVSYRCMLCRAVLKDYELAAGHVAREHVGRVRCPICDKGFKRAICLSKHVEQCRSAPKQHACPVCDKLCDGKPQLSKHMRSHSPHSLILNCDTCHLQFKSRYALKRHLLTHEASVRCSACDQLCKNPQTLEVHMLTHSGRRNKTPPEARCPHCERVCSNRQMLKRHVARMHAPDRQKKFECDHCGNRFMTKGEAREHISWTHMGARRAHACRCGRVFRTPARLRAHVATAHMHKRTVKDHLCDVCQKAFASNSERNRHKRTHAGTRYPCPECGETFKTSTYVIIHHKLRHMNMTREDIRQQNKQKREQRMQDIAKAHKKKIRKVAVYNQGRDAKNVRDKIGFVRKPKVSVADVGGNKCEDKEISVPKFDTFVDVLKDND